MVRTCIDSTLKELDRLESHPKLFLFMKDDIQTLQPELKFLKMFVWCLAKLDNKNLPSRCALKINIEAAIRKAGQGLNATAFKAIKRQDYKDWDLLVSRLLKKVRQFKPTVKATCLDLLASSSLPYKSSTSYEANEFIESILKNLNDLVSLKADMIVTMKQQIGVLQEKLRLIRNFNDFARKLCINHEEFKDLKTHSQSRAHDAACLSLLYWVDNMEEEVAPRMNFLLSEMIRKTKPVVFEVGMYFGVASKCLRHDIFLVTEVVHNSIEILHDRLIFLASLIIHPPEGDPDDGNLTSTQADAIVKEAASLLSSYWFGEVKENIVKENNVLSTFLEKVEMIKETVRQLLHVQIPYSSLDFPKTNGLGFMDFLLRNLEDKLKCTTIPIAKHQLLAVHGGLMFMMPILKDILQLQNECSEVKELWKQIINLAYTTEHVIDSFSINDSPMWCNFICLSNVIEEIESIPIKVKKVKDKRMFNIRSVITDEMNASQILTIEANSSSQTHVFVGFKDEEAEIINRLTSHSTERDIVSIVGMPGLGKTTLAKRVYDSAFVRRVFHKHAWCCVSQFYKRKELLSAILKDVGISDGEIEKNTEEGLEDLLYKNLKGQRYLVVLDDIWDVDAWKALQQSFPDDGNGSRILLTSRRVDVAFQVNPNSYTHSLRSFSDEECWELLRKYLFHTDECPQNLLDVGIQIAKKCKGLPLAVVVVAGLLAKEVKNLSWWGQIEESLSQHIAGTRCMDILELSYNHLPDFLKPCFLYFRAFKEDQRINAKALTLFWIAEGFIVNPGSKSLEEVAQEYLLDLFSRNLVLVSRKSSNGIKECYMHDLILELCREKAQEENFMEVVREDDLKQKQVSSQSNPPRYDKYRLSIHADPSSFLHSSATGPCVRSIIFPCKFSFVSDFIDLRNFCNNFKFLKVLRLWFWYIELDWLSIELTSLVHLTYLAVIYPNESIPPSIANLKNLETLLLRSPTAGTFPIELPNTMWKMRRLRHVKIDNASISSSDHLFEESYELDNIESFSSVIIKHEGDVEKLVRRIPRVRKLKFIICGSWDNQFSALGSLSKLEALSLSYWGNIWPYPYAISFPSSLKKLALMDLWRPWKEISVIGKLPNLEVLKLRKLAFDGEIWDVEDGEFFNLKYLKLSELEVRHWNASSDHFPRLQQLYVVNCEELEEIPSSFGAISTLKMISVRGCSDNATSSAWQIVKEQQDLGNEDLEVDISTEYDWDEISMKES